MCSQQEPRRGSVVVSISFLHNHNRPSPRLDAIQCSCHQAALNRFAIFACMVFRMMRHLRCQSLLLFHFHLFYTLNALAYHNVGICLWHVSLQTVMYQRISNKPKKNRPFGLLTNQKNRPFGLQCSRLWHVSIQTAMYQRIGNMPKACPYVMMRFLQTGAKSIFDFFGDLGNNKTL